MRYFTRAWYSGESTDDAVSRYELRLQEIVAQLPPAVRVLALECNLHDALIQKARWNPGGKVLEILLRAGDLQVGYFDLLLRYHQARIRSPATAELARIVEDPYTEVLYDEVDIDGEDATHTWLFWPAGELEVGFVDMQVGRMARNTRDFEAPPERFEIVSC